jgi:ABC-type polysaccharide/polyol phosphate transport system ATPase subunit
MFHRNWFTRRRSSSGAEADSADGETKSVRTGPGSVQDPAPASRARARRTDWELEDDLDEDELDDDDEDDEDDDEIAERVGGPTPNHPGEMFWALRDISLQLPRGAALGVLGGPDAGKSTLLRILAGRAFPTEGRVLYRDPISPLPDALAKAYSATGRGTHTYNLIMGARLLGIERHVLKPHKDEIEELAQPLLGEDGEPLPGAMLRLALATAIVLPTNAILLDELKGVDEAFVELVVERVRQRVRHGTALVVASRQPEIVQELCDEAILLQGGSISHHGGVKDVLGSYQGMPATGDGQRAGSRNARRRRPQTPSPGGQQSLGQSPDVPAVVPAFNQWAALLSAELKTASRRAKRLDATSGEVAVEIKFETAVPDLEALCGVSFTPRDGDATGMRMELSEPLRFADPASYVLVARPRPGALRSGDYDVRADAVISDPAEGGSTVIAREIGRVRIQGNESSNPPETSIKHWDGRELWLAEAEWSID